MTVFLLLIAQIFADSFFEIPTGKICENLRHLREKKTKTGFRMNLPEARSHWVLRNTRTAHSTATFPCPTLTPFIFIS
jgi:hypothetical protein